MKAVVLEGFGDLSYLVLREVEEPRPGPGQVTDSRRAFVRGGRCPAGRLRHGLVWVGRHGVIGHRFQLAEVAGAHALVEGRRSFGKVIIIP